MCHARYEKPLKNQPLDVAKKYVEIYTTSNAVTPDLGEEENRVNHRIYDIYKASEPKTDWRRMINISHQNL